MVNLDSVANLPDTAEAFAEWVEPHIDVMDRLATRLAPGTDPEDEVQEALLRAWRKRSQFDENKAARLLAITVDRARRVRARTRPAVELSDLAAPERSTDDLDVQHAVSRLSHRQRLAVDLFYFVGLSVSETAALMKYSEGTVKSTPSDATNRLRPMLEVAG